MTTTNDEHPFGVDADLAAGHDALFEAVETGYSNLDDLDAVLAQPLPDPTDEALWQKLLHALETAPPPPSPDRRGRLHHLPLDRSAVEPEVLAYRRAAQRYAESRRRCRQLPFGSPERQAAIEAALAAEATLQAAQPAVRRLGYRSFPVDSSNRKATKNSWRWGPR